MEKKKYTRERFICPACHKPVYISFSEEEYDNYVQYLNGVGLIQDMLPNMLPAEREILMGGMCGDCWIRLFSLPPSEDDFSDECEEDSV